MPPCKRNNSCNSPPMCIPPQRPILESLRMPGQVTTPLSQARIVCTTHPPTCSVVSQRNSDEEEYCTAGTCCSSVNCISSRQECCPLSKVKEAEAFKESCQRCRPQQQIEDNGTGPCREKPAAAVVCATTCKDTATEATVGCNVDRHTSLPIISSRSQSMPCLSNLHERHVSIHQSPTQMSAEIPLCCRPQTNSVHGSSGSSIYKSGTSSFGPSQPNSVTNVQAMKTDVGGIKKPCCTTIDRNSGSGQQVSAVPILPKKINSRIANGSFQELAAISTCNRETKQRKSDHKIDDKTGSCTHAMCPANTNECPCCFPPAFSHFGCTGLISGNCNCAQNK